MARQDICAFFQKMAETPILPQYQLEAMSRRELEDYRKSILSILRQCEEILPDLQIYATTIASTMLMVDTPAIASTAEEDLMRYLNTWRAN